MARGRPNPWPVYVTSALALALTSLPLLISLTLFIVITTRIVTGATSPNAAPIWLFLGTVFFAIRLARGAFPGASGASVEDVERCNVSMAAGGLQVEDATLPLQSMALEQLGGSVALDSALLPGLLGQLEELQVRLRLPALAAPQLVSDPMAYVAAPGEQLVGMPALAALSTDEFRAVVAYRMALAGDPTIRRVARLARLGSTTGRTHARDRGGLIGWLYIPASAAGDLVEWAAQRYARRARVAARAAAATLAPAPALDSGLARERVVQGLWAATLAAWQRYWAHTSDAVRPIATWEAAIAAAAASGQPVPAEPIAHADVLARYGWHERPPATVQTCPPAPTRTALRELGGSEADAAIAQADDLLAAAYYGDWIATRVGPRGEWPQEMLPAAVDGITNDVATVLTSVDPYAAAPMLDLILRQADALLEAMLRRDAGAILVAHAIERTAASPALGAVAAGTSYLAGDADAPRRLAAWLQHDFTSACTLRELTPTLRFGGQYALADWIDAAVTSLVPLINAPIRLDGVRSWRRVRASALNERQLQVAQEAVSLLPAGWQAWAASYDAGDVGAIPLLVLRKRRGHPLEPPGEPFARAVPAVAIAAPAMRLLEGEISGDAWRAIKRLGVPLTRNPSAPAAPAPAYATR